MRTASRSAYLDSSALIKLCIDEPGGSELRSILSEIDERLSSSLAVVEVSRGVKRYAPYAVGPASQVLAGTSLVRIDDSVLSAAIDIQPTSTSASDAVHVATALSLGRGLHTFITYDKRQADAARAHGLTVLSPGT